MNNVKIEFLILVCGILQIVGFVLTIFATKMLFAMPNEMTLLMKAHALPFWMKDIMSIAGFAGFINFGFLIEDSTLYASFTRSVTISSFIFMLAIIIFG